MNDQNHKKLPFALFETPLLLLRDLLPGCRRITLRRKGFEDLAVPNNEDTALLSWQLEAPSPVDGATDATLILEGDTDSAPNPLPPAPRRAIELVGQQLSLHLQSKRHQSESLALANLLESMPDAVVTCNQDGLLEHFNGIARKWHGTDPRRVPAESWSKDFDP